jgi:hypothetical protein
MRLKRKCGNCAAARRVAGCLFDCNKVERVMRELDRAMWDEARQTDPIMEQIKQCPEAFKAGELVGKMFDSIKYALGDTTGEERCLPPPGAVLPPLV